MRGRRFTGTEAATHSPGTTPATPPHPHCSVLLALPPCWPPLHPSFCKGFPSSPLWLGSVSYSICIINNFLTFS